MTRLTNHTLAQDRAGAFAEIKRIVLAGDVDLWRQRIATDVDITTLRSASQNLLHLAMSADADHEAMIAILLQHAKGVDKAWRMFLNHRRKDGKTPLDLARQKGHKHSATLLARKGGLSGAHFDVAVRYTKETLLVAHDGTTAKVKLGERPKEFSWAHRVLLFMHHDLAAIAAYAPELMRSFHARDGYHVLAETDLNDFDLHINLAPDPSNKNGAISKVWRTTQTNNPADIFRENFVCVYTVFDYEYYFGTGINLSGHELTHIADAELCVEKNDETLTQDYQHGWHSKRKLFLLICELDAIFERDIGVIGCNKDVLTSKDYQENPHREYFARKAEELIVPLAQTPSPLFTAYWRMIFLPQVGLLKRHQGRQLKALDDVMREDNPEQALGAQTLNALQAYRDTLAKLAGPIYRNDSAARTRLREIREQTIEQLLERKPDVQERLERHMRLLVSRAATLYASRQGLDALSHPQPPIMASTCG